MVRDKCRLKNFKRPPATINGRIELFLAYIRNQGTKLCQNHDLVEKNNFWSKMVNTLTKVDSPLT